MYATPSDDVLLRRFSRDRDEEAFSEIVRRYAGFVFATCNRVLRDRAWAEDVSQETFLRLMRKPQSIQRSLAGWLHKAATQLAIDALRSNSSRRNREVTYACECCDHEVSSWQEISPHVDEALAEMPEEVRSLLVQHFLHGIPQRELAAELHTSTSTISRRIQQGLETLRQQLRRKGIVVAAVLLAESLALNSAEAAPPALMRELGKMAMVSGTRPPDPAELLARRGGLPPETPVEYGSVYKMAWTALAGAGIIGIVMCVLWLKLARPDGTVRFIWQEEPVPATQEHHAEPR